MAEFTYFLAQSAVRVAGRRVLISDPYDAANAQRESIEDLEVDLVHIAHTDFPFRVELNRGDRRFDVDFTPDGRMRSLGYNSTGAGTSVVMGVAKFAAFVGSLLLNVFKGGGLAGDEKPEPRAVWEEAYPDMATRKKAYIGIAKSAATELAEVRGAMVNADFPELRDLERRARVLEGVLSNATDEVAKVERLYTEWRAAQRTKTESDVEVRILVAELPVRSAQGYAPPAEPAEGQDGYKLWRDCGLYLEVTDPLPSSLPNLPDGSSSVGSSNVVWWRQPREVELWVWKKDDDQVALVSRSTIRISDHSCSYGSMELTSKMFGENGGSLAFNDDGSPSKVSQNQASAWGAFADALGGVPDAVGNGVTQAKNVLEAVTSIRDAQSERERARTARELEIAENQLKLAGVEATEADYAKLQSAEQAVKLQAARRSLSPVAIAVEDLQQQLDLVTKQNKLDSERRSAVIESSISDLRAEVARLEVEVKKVEALAELQ